MRTHRKKYRVTLKLSQIRKLNAFLRNWANDTESDDLASLLTAHLVKTDIRGKRHKPVLKGI